MPTKIIQFQIEFSLERKLYKFESTISERQNRRHTRLIRGKNDCE